MICWSQRTQSSASVDGGADELVGAVPPGAELDLLAVDQDELAVAGQRAVGGDEVEGVGLAAARFAAEQHVALGEVDVDVLAVLVDAQVDRAEHGQREHRHGRRWWWWSWCASLPEVQGTGRPRAVPGALPAVGVRRVRAVPR